MNKNNQWIPGKAWMAVLLLTTGLLQGCMTYRYADISKDVPEIAPGFLQGYIPLDELPDSRELLSPPPERGSAAYAHDMEVAAANLRLRDLDRWEQAAEDAYLGFPGALDSYNDLLPLPVTEETTPYLYLLLRRTLIDASLSTYTAKQYYQRERPFMVNGQPTCTPEVEDQLRKDGSYPSGHTAIGWAWALILAEVYPGQAEALLLRGREFGESRSVCNVHWYSDVVAGRLMGASTVAVLHADETFQHDLKKAIREVKKRTE
jgi:acid phosphatase (class A)